MTEHDIQREYVKRLKDGGFLCCVTSNGKKTANTRGTPDVFIYLQDGLWIALESKSEDGRLTPEQGALSSEGAIGIIRNVDQALAYIVKKEAEYARRGLNKP